MKVENMDDGGWEDVPGTNVARLSRTQSASPSPIGVRMPTRRRKTHKKANLTPSMASRRSATPAVQLQEETPALVDREQVQRAFLSGASATVSYVVDVLATAFWLLKKPLGVFAFVVAWGSVGLRPGQVPIRLSPLCIIPGISSSMICAARPRSSPAVSELHRACRAAGHFEGIMTANVARAR
ncbi:uncharacterized protein B0H18DRAFT_1118058 [Fomitopsis serialis]|uniref:uncharacterized protein n=1 Tax=Fomitopsis serialis TaxID=139415 RepID=UPI002007F62A|nr:uncharacterized protein B0H18DRAFT_1118058 [Neoantrodia serialis]KAH9928385.1 hypothetical protein B0H18DRAFT_1118058 [Neoantrodia serialis]